MINYFVEYSHIKDVNVYYMKSIGFDREYSMLPKDVKKAVIRLSNKTLNDVPSESHNLGHLVLNVVLLAKVSDVDLLSKLAQRAQGNSTSKAMWLLRLPIAENRTESITSIKSLLEDFPLDYDSLVYLYTQEPGSASEEFNIYEAYKVSLGDEEVQVLHLGTHSRDRGLELDETNIWIRRANLNGKHFRASTLPNKPYLTMVEDGCQGPECLKGIFADVFHKLQSTMNFTYTISMPEDGEWGALREDGTWTGIVGK